jgi:hypothetical protein
MTSEPAPPADVDTVVPTPVRDRFLRYLYGIDPDDPTHELPLPTCPPEHDLACAFVLIDWLARTVWPAWLEVLDLPEQAGRMQDLPEFTYETEPHNIRVVLDADQQLTGARRCTSTLVDQLGTSRCFDASGSAAHTVRQRCGLDAASWSLEEFDVRIASPMFLDPSELVDTVALQTSLPYRHAPADELTEAIVASLTPVADELAATLPSLLDRLRAVDAAS